MAGDETRRPRALLGDYYTTGEVAEKLGWSVDTIRRHLVPMREWKRDTGKVPYRLLGARYMIPVWWLRSVLEDAHTPPSARATGDEPPQTA